MNRLASESSPYLRQHAENPVDWWPWCDEAFAEADRRNVPVLLSVGYSACHWCHVMAHESFENATIAAQMNEHFVNIKVDREERPDVDAIYMEATQAMTGRGGWPMTVLMKPSGEPFYCGTYFPDRPRGGMPSFPQVLDAIAELWEQNPDDVEEQALALTERITRQPDLPKGHHRLGPADLDAAERILIDTVDATHGGFGTAPKFPHSMAIELLLQRALSETPTGDGRAEAATLMTVTLDAMAAGGIYDHVGGGFARYSTDATWTVPHFEKMLYDNALLVRTFARAYSVLGHERYRRVVTETVDYLLDDLRHPEGGFLSAEDADSANPSGETREGSFYVWDLDEFTDVVGPDAREAIEHFGLTASGDFEDSNVLAHQPGHGLEEGTRFRVREALRAARSSRQRPAADDKVLTEWNALTIAALCDAADFLGEEEWVAEAVVTATFLLDRARAPDGRWLRSWQEDSGARHLAFAHDHAALVEAFVRLYQSTGDQAWLEHARDVADALIDLFFDGDIGCFHTTGSDADALITRPIDLIDGATPSAQSTAASALFRLAALTGEDRYRSVSETVTNRLAALAVANPLAFPGLLSHLREELGERQEVVIVGTADDFADTTSEPSRMARLVRSQWRPGTIHSWGTGGPGPLWNGRAPGAAYVCQHFACGVPATSLGELESQLSE